MAQDRPQSFANDFDAEFAERYEVERARWLRRRFLWYCAIAVVAFAVSAASNIIALFTAEPAEPSRASTLLDMAGDILLTMLYTGAALLIATRRPDRKWLVMVMTVLIVVAATVCMFVSPVTTFIDTNAGESWGMHGEMFALALGASGLVATFLLHFLGSLFIALTPREAVRPLIPVAVIFVLITLLMNPGNLITKLILIGLFPFMGAPGVLWSWWRASTFRERFENREISGRLGEISLELAYARRIHEALFPPAVRRGPVRVEYHYEPMRQIGGDFLFVHPLAMPPVELDEPVSIVLIDVSGHGVGAALAVNRLHGELTRFFFVEPDGSPGELLRALNAFAYASLAPQGVFASAFVIRVDSHTRTAVWASAGHPAAMVRRGSGTLTELNSTAVLLGVVEDAAFDPGAREIALEPSDVIVAYTDGVIEARNAADEQFGMRRLRDSLIATATTRSETGGVARAIAEQVRQFRHGPVTDDLLVIEVFLSHDKPAIPAETGEETAKNESPAGSGIG